jgi:hypothetical protein
MTTGGRFLEITIFALATGAGAKLKDEYGEKTSVNSTYSIFVIA